MSQLGDDLRMNLADTFALYLKTHNYHWNVEGENFYEYHKFLDDIYNELWEAVDAIAEHIRAIGEYAPGSFSRYSELTVIKDETGFPETGLDMIKQLAEDNDKVISRLKVSQMLAEQVGEVGVANFLQDRIDIHNKHQWMFKATIKNR